MTEPAVWVVPPLRPAEVEFVEGFTRRAAVRRVWPGQPSAASPWRPTADGSCLVLDDGTSRTGAVTVAAWLQYLADEFLAPATPAALDLALRHGLRGGHQLCGEVVVGATVIAVDRQQVEERALQRDGGQDTDA